MDPKTIKIVSNIIIENLPEEEKVRFSKEERELLESTLRVREENRDNPKIVASCDRTLANMQTILDRIKFKAFVDASIDIAASLIVVGVSITQPELAPVLAIVTKKISKKAKEIY